MLHRLKSKIHLALLISASASLSACALFQDHDAKSNAMLDAETRVPAQWQAPLPHDGKVADLKRWWDQFDDPLLSELVAAGEAVNPNLSSARSRIAQARATSVSSGAALLPKLDAAASRTRGQQDIRFPAGTSTSTGLNASWEIDLFGANSAASDAADLRFSGARAEWHVARVSVAAEVANTYIGYRACEAQLAQTEIDAASRKETARLTDINANVGFESPANAALTRASAAQGNSLLVQQRAQCDLQIKALVALTAIDEPTLRQKLTSANVGHIPQPAQINVVEVPAAALAQRPDIYSAAQTVLAANADVDNLRAQRLPRITLAGNISRATFETSQGSTSGRVWTVGPIQITLPIFDGGIRRANVDAGRARYDDAAIQYAGKIRTAVREVEEALVNLQSTGERAVDAQTAVDGFAASFRGVEARQKNGMANIFELEDSRRSLATAQTALVNLQRDRVTAWVSLYRALGGGWDVSEADNDVPAQPGVGSPTAKN
jgi:NodT family efflux transporter outer membrane factor (OMF) lipoprotein